MAEVRPCDLYSVRGTSAALAGAAAVVVSLPALVPRAQLLQASRRAAILFALDTVVRAGEALGIPVYAPTAEDALWIHGLAPGRPPSAGRVVRPVWQGGSAGVVSIQEMGARPGTHADRAMDAYLTFLRARFRGAVAVREAHARIAFAVPFGPPLLSFLREPDGDAQRAHLTVVGGLLGRPRGGAFEFRIVETRADGPRLLTAVHGFAPRLPFPVYARTQAPVHARVMDAFAHAWEGSLPRPGSASVEA